MSRTRKLATIADVAKRCDVSTATVSRVLNNSGVANEALRLKVEQAAKELGYVFPRARSYRREKTSLVLVLTPDLLNPYFNEIIKVVQDTVSREELRCLTTEVRDIHGVRRTLDLMHQPLIRGCVLFGGIASSPEVAALVDRCPFPIVLINHIIDRPGILCINIDYARAASQGTRHLLELGHREFAFIGGRHGSDIGREKIRGIRAALAEQGLTLDERRILSGSPTTDWGFQATLSLLRAGEGRPTAIICSCDLIALGALHAIRSMQYSVPEHVSVLGFDDISMACHANPPLTTIAPPKEKIGRLAVSLVGARSEKPGMEVSNYVVFESPLIVRSSTGPVDSGIA